MGATVPESAGLYFSWGNKEGHPAGSGYNFSQEEYETTPAASIRANLSLDEDAARTYLGEPWRIPTANEVQELYDNCTKVWTRLNNVNGCLFTSNVNGNTLFIPAAGYYNGLTFSGRGFNGEYWTSTYVSETTARRMLINSSIPSPLNSNNRALGFTIRAVQESTPNRSIVPPTPEDGPKDEETPTVEEPKDSNER